MAKFCSNCGAALRSDSVFCEECGARVAPTAPQETQPVPPATDNGSVFAGFTPASGTVSIYTRTQTMTEAAEIAVSRNPQGKWSYWCSADKYRNLPWNLRTFAEKEDKRLGRFDDRGGMLYYVVSPGGSLGQVYADEMNDGRPVLEWVYFAPGEGESTLPSAPEML